MTEQGPNGPRDAKAELKAAKAYSKAQRPWYKRKRWMIPLSLFLLIGIISAASGGGDSTKTSTTDNNAAQSSTTEEAPAEDTAKEEEKPKPAKSSGPTANFPIEDGDWSLDSLRVKDDGLGDFGGTGRVTYNGSNPDGGTNIFTVTVFVSGKDVATLSGSANGVKAGDAVSVQFISQEKFVGGPYKYDFQNDL